jgi:hypothetical protein
MMQRVDALAALLAASLAVGFVAGYYTRSRHGDAQVIEDAAATVRQSGVNIVRSAETSQRIEASIQDADVRIGQLNKAAQVRLQKREVQDGQDIDNGRAADHAGASHPLAAAPAVVGAEPAGVCNDGTLDFGIVRLLNRARDESTVESATGSPDEIRTVAQAGGRSGTAR